MTGHLEGHASGSPVEIDATGKELLITLFDLKSAWRLRRFAGSSLTLLRRLRDLELGVTLQTRHGHRFRLLPKTSLLIRAVAPELRKL